MVVTENNEFSVIVPDYLESSETGNEAESEQDHGEMENENDDTQNEIEENENENVTVDYSDSLDSIIINQQSQTDVLIAIQEQNDTIISSLELVASGVHFVTNLSLLVVICTVALLIGKFFKNLMN